MLIKKITHKSRLSLTPLLRYMIDGMEKESDMMIAHNLPSFDLYDMTQAFLENDEYRRDPRATVVWYHEVLSFSPKDSAYLDNQKIEQITQEYINRRNPSSLCFAVSHMGDAHKHIHLCFGSVEYRSSDKSLRMDNKTFKNLREGMEMWQREQFPELRHSIVYLDREQEKHKSKVVRQERHKRKNNEAQAKKRMGDAALRKEVLAETVQRCYDQSRTPAEFIRLVKNTGLSIYERNGKAAGIIDTKKYRFATLGITKSMLLSLDRFAERQCKAEQLSKNDESWERER